MPIAERTISLFVQLDHAFGDVLHQFRYRCSLCFNSSSAFFRSLISIKLSTKWGRPFRVMVETDLRIAFLQFPLGGQQQKLRMVHGLIQIGNGTLADLRRTHKLMADRS